MILWCRLLFHDATSCYRVGTRFFWGGDCYYFGWQHDALAGRIALPELAGVCGAVGLCLGTLAVAHVVLPCADVATSVSGPEGTLPGALAVL